MSNPIELQKALVLKRESVIKKLEENFEKEKTKRVEAETKEKEARQEFADFCEEHQEQIVNYVAAMIYGSGGSWAAVLEEAKRVFEEKNSYKTPESIPSRLETELEKFVRVLKMGAEDTIEVKPTQAVYDLL